MHQGHQEPPPRTDAVARRCLDAAFAVHKQLGPGLLESVYEACLEYELRSRGLHVDRQRPLPVINGDLKLEAGYRVDLMVEGAVTIECKAVEALAPVHTAQVMTYLKLSALRVGLLMNFNVVLLRQGLRRVVL